MQKELKLHTCAVHLTRCCRSICQACKARLQTHFKFWIELFGSAEPFPLCSFLTATWQLVFPWLEKLCKPAAGYLQATYFCRSAPSGLQKQLHCTEDAVGCRRCLVCRLLGRCFGDIPWVFIGHSARSKVSTDTGSPGLSDKKRGLRPTQIFEVMQKVYEAAALLNSQSLRSAGRSPAVGLLARTGPKAMRKLKLLQGNSPHRPEQHRR